MNFASDFPTYPMVANTDYSPTAASYDNFDTDSLDKAYLADSYTATPDHSLSNFLDCDSFFEQPVPSVELRSNFVPKGQALFNPTMQASAYRTNFNSAPFGHLPQYESGFTFEPLTSDPFGASCVSPTQTQLSSRTPSLCGDGPQNIQTSSPEQSPRVLKRESPDDGVTIDEEPTPKRPQKKRGRPRLDRTLSDSTSCTGSNKNQRTARLPHNQVERKYREGLNNELERLRRAVPTLPQYEEGSAMGQPKPSKAMVLAGAIDYIRKIERERDELLEENECLRNGGSSSKRGSTRGYGQTKSNTDVVDEFLVDD